MRCTSICRGVILLFLGFASAAVSEVPGHYLVFELVDGEPVPVFHRLVDLGAMPAAGGDREGGEGFAYRLLDERGTEVLAGRVSLMPYRREDFAVSPGSQPHLDPAPAHDAPSAFILRLPVLTGGRLILDTPVVMEFELEALAARSMNLALAARAGSGRLERLGSRGDPANRVDLLLVSEGFTAAEKPAFDAAARQATDALFAVSPHAEYRDFFNVSTLFVPSAESGADHPPFDPHCASGFCCPDPGSQGDALAGARVDSAFDATYCGYGLFRLLVVDEAKVFAAAAADPDWDQVLVVVNDPTYGGSGDLVGVTSLHSGRQYLVPHEFGHIFTGLADEYDSAFRWPPCSDVTGPPCEPNVTDETVAQLVKWEPWLDPQTPVPTPEGDATYDGHVGVFEGARYESEGMYRPTDHACVMNKMTKGFCPVCREAFVQRLYEGGWGAPAEGIDLIEPGSEHPRPGRLSVGGPVQLGASLLSPRGASPEVSWWVNGSRVAAATGAEYDFVPPEPGLYEVELRVVDRTSLVHPESQRGSLQSSRTWQVEARSGAGCQEGATVLCLGEGGRFRVSADWQTRNGSLGAGRVVYRSSDSGLLWFFDPDNWELLVKVLDGCGTNGHYWVFFAGTTNVAFDLEVLDTLTGKSKRYHNPLDHDADAVNDTSAFATCN